MTGDEAFVVAFTAHTAIGQMRADGVTPYIAHPHRVVAIIDEMRMDESFCDVFLTEQEWLDCRVAGYLHDVVEDTKMEFQHLINLGITDAQLDIVERMTKPGQQHEPAQESYYKRISQSVQALVVKCADRSANLEDAHKDLLAPVPKEPRRWERYISDTTHKVLPLYVRFPRMLDRLETVLSKIENDMPAALERRRVVVLEDLMLKLSAHNHSPKCAGEGRCIRCHHLKAAIQREM